MAEILFLIGVPVLIFIAGKIYSLWRKARKIQQERDRRFDKIIEEIKARYQEEEQKWGV